MVRIQSGHWKMDEGSAVGILVWADFFFLLQATKGWFPFINVQAIKVIKVVSINIKI